MPETKAEPAKFRTYRGEFGRLEAKRLLDRAGFGARPREAKRLARRGRRKAVRSLTRPPGSARLVGARPRDGEGNPLARYDAWGHDHLWWLDRMVRSDQPLIERMCLVWHDWFATSTDKVSQRLILDQNEMFRAKALGSFHDLLISVTKDPAMLVWLDGIENTRRHPQENYARELMELFSLGPNRGAYTEGDIREMARALTGWRAEWDEDIGLHGFRFDASRHDPGRKTIFGKTGNYDWRDACRLVVEHPKHARFFVEKLWSYFVAEPPHADTRAELERIYRREDYRVRPVLEAILEHPDFYRGPRMVKPPVVHLASMLRARRRGIDTEEWVWLCEGAGQRLFSPPNVSGWDHERWLDTSTMRARWHLVTYIQHERTFDPWPRRKRDRYRERESAERALNRALAYWDWPPLTKAHRAEILRFSRHAFPGRLEPWEKSPYRAQRQNALRQLIPMSPDFLQM